MARKRWFITLGLVAAIGLVTTACSSDDNGGGSSGSTGGTTGGATATGSTSSGGGATVSITEKDFAIAASPNSVSSGDLHFVVSNEGPSTHEFVIFNTDLAPEELPLADDGTVDEEGEGVEHVDEIEDIAAGTKGTLDVTLDPGTYVFICNLPGHYKAGMNTAFTVA